MTKYDKTVLNGNFMLDLETCSYKELLEECYCELEDMLYAHVDILKQPFFIKLETMLSEDKVNKKNIQNIIISSLEELKKIKLDDTAIYTYLTKLKNALDSYSDKDNNKLTISDLTVEDDSNYGNGIYIIKKEGIIFNGTEESFLEKDFKKEDLLDVSCLTSYESNNYILYKKESFVKIIKNIEDARDFMYTTVLLDLPDFDSKTECLVFCLTH